jgi:hypothetical protein
VLAAVKVKRGEGPMGWKSIDLRIKDSGERVPRVRLTDKEKHLGNKMHPSMASTIVKDMQGRTGRFFAEAGKYAFRAEVNEQGGGGVWAAQEDPPTSSRFQVPGF